MSFYECPKCGGIPGVSFCCTDKVETPPKPAQQWQPIETAPKDGTWILAINAAKNPGRQHVVHYSERWGNHYPWVTGSAPMDFVAGVTHWMPLPAPPQQ